MLYEAAMLEGAASEVPYMADCVRRFPHLTSWQLAVVEYTFNQDKAELYVHSHLPLYYLVPIILMFVILIYLLPAMS